MPSKMQPDDDHDEFGWGEHKPGFFSPLKRKWQEYKLHKAILAEEKRALKQFHKEIKGAPSADFSEMEPGKPKGPFAEESEGRVLKSGSAPQAKPVSFWARVRDDRALRREILEENKRAEMSYGPPAGGLNRPDTAGSDFGVGSSQDQSGDDSGPPAPTPRMMLQGLKVRLLNSRIPQWSLATVPAIAMFALVVVPAVTESDDNIAAINQRYQARLPELVKEKHWDEINLIAHRIFSTRLTRMDDLFAYSDMLMAQNQEIKAWNFLRSREDSQNEPERGLFLFRCAEKILGQKNLSPVMVNLALTKLVESLKHALPIETETRARQVLARYSSSRGDLESAYRVLEPIQSRDLTIASEILWLKWNINANTTLQDYQLDAQRLLGDLDIKLAKVEKPTGAEIACRSRLLMLLNRENDARGWVAGLGSLSNEEKTTWSRELDQLSLALAVKRTPIDEKQIWLKLLPLLESDPDNMLWHRIATSLWAAPRTEKNEEAFQWVQNRINSSKVSLPFLRQAAMNGHMNGRWDLVRPVYRKIVELDPADVASLNNLAGILYKFPPFQYEEALKLMDRALAPNPDNLGLLETRGQILARMGKLDEAREILERCLPVLPNEWNIHNTLAQIYELQGQKSRGQVHRERMASLKKPNNAPLIDDIKAATASLK